MKIFFKTLFRCIAILLVVVSTSKIAVADTDTDNDGVPDAIDGQPLTFNPVQADISFADAGTAITPTGDFNDGPMAMVLQSDGKPVLAGITENAKSRRHMMLVRYNANGSLDTSFDGDGKLAAVGNAQSYATSIIQQPDGKLVVAGVKKSGSFVASVLLRYLPDGLLDTSFGKKGKVVHKIGAGSAASSLVILPDGRFVVAGVTRSGSIIGFYVARYKANGGLDHSFGNNGVRVVRVGGGKA
ncbi:MAG TPA: delta-60 repeat domain-containing protein, partial [Pseudomonadales bacterium]|nr:delta-60 repeat domain-containing protein [Pseudomonadales bacterium]